MGALLVSAFLLSIEWNLGTELFPSRCQDYHTEYSDFSIRQYICDSNGKLLEERNIFRRTGTPEKFHYFNENGDVILTQFWDVDENLKGYVTFEHFADGTYISRSWNPTKISYLESQEQKRLTGRIPDFRVDPVLKRWKLNSKGKTIYIDTLYEGTGNLIKERFIYSSQEKPIKKLTIQYQDGEIRPDNDDPKIYGFEIFDVSDKKIGSYHIGEKFNLRQVYSEEDLSKYEKVFNAPREPVVIIDSGFDYLHPDLAYHAWQNPREPIDGVDNDRNGWVDDWMGWNWASRGEQYNLPWEKIRLQQFRDGGIPFSHGTHVASIAFKEIEKFGLVGFAGKYLDTEYVYKIQEFLISHQIRFTNMSFGGNEGDMFSRMLDANWGAFQTLIEKASHTLHFVAAGNEPIDLDQEISYLASYDVDNLMVIGAVDTDEIRTEDISKYRMADFSSYGEETVDILAPGVKVMGAIMGSDREPASGTSMATPFALNQALRVAETVPRLDPQEIKELMMKTAYVPLDRPFPVRSGGVVFPERLLKAAQYLKSNSNWSVQEAAIQVLRDEFLDEGTLDQLKKFWIQRGI